MPDAVTEALELVRRGPPTPLTEAWLTTMVQARTLLLVTQALGKKPPGPPPEYGPEEAQSFVEAAVLYALVGLAGLEFPEGTAPGAPRRRGRAPRARDVEAAQHHIRRLPGDLWATFVDVAWSDEVRWLLLEAPSHQGVAQKVLSAELLEAQDEASRVRLLDALFPASTYQGLASDVPAERLRTLLSRRPKPELRRRAIRCLVRLKPSSAAEFLAAKADRLAVLEGADVHTPPEPLLPLLKSTHAQERRLATLALCRVPSPPEEAFAALAANLPEVPREDLGMVLTQLERGPFRLVLAALCALGARATPAGKDARAWLAGTGRRVVFTKWNLESLEGELEKAKPRSALARVLTTVLEPLRRERLLDQAKMISAQSRNGWA